MNNNYILNNLSNLLDNNKKFLNKKGGETKYSYTSIKQETQDTQDTQEKHENIQPESTDSKNVLDHAKSLENSKKKSIIDHCKLNKMSYSKIRNSENLIKLNKRKICLQTVIKLNYDMSKLEKKNKSIQSSINKNKTQLEKFKTTNTITESELDESIKSTKENIKTIFTELKNNKSTFNTGIDKYKNNIKSVTYVTLSYNNIKKLLVNNNDPEINEKILNIRANINQLNNFYKTKNQLVKNMIRGKNINNITKLYQKYHIDDIEGGLNQQCVLIQYQTKINELESKIVNLHNDQTRLIEELKTINSEIKQWTKNNIKKNKEMNLKKFESIISDENKKTQTNIGYIQEINNDFEKYIETHKLKVDELFNILNKIAEYANKMNMNLYNIEILSQREDI